MLTQPLLLGALTGLASSVHCAAMCGPLAASVCSRSAPRTSLARYQLGRAVGYGAAGAIAGGVGHAVQVSASWSWLGYVVPALTVIALLVLARRVLQTSAGLTQIRRPTEPKRSSIFARLARIAPRDPSVLGALTALLPCGALAAALLLAAATQARDAGALLMLGFATTSALGVLAGGLVLERAARLGSRVAPRALAVLLTCAAFYVGLKPVYLHLRAEGAERAAHAPACH